MDNMTELESRLAAPGGQALRNELQDRLADLEQRMRWKAAERLPRDQHAQAAALADAALAAQDVLRRWRIK